MKSASDVKIGDTYTDCMRPCPEPLPGFKEIRPMVFSGIYPVDSSDFEALKAAMAQREADFDAVLEEKRAAAAKEAEAFAQQQRDAAKAQADKILSDAKDAAESERQKIVAEANREALAIAEDAMEKLMAAQTAQAYDAFVNAAKEEQNEH